MSVDDDIMKGVAFVIKGVFLVGVVIVGICAIKGC